MSDYSLCGGYDSQQQCASCWRRYVEGDATRTNHPYPPNEYAQSWELPAPADPCPLHIPVEAK